MNNDRALVRSFGKNLHRYFRVMSVKARICPFGGPAGEFSYLLSSSKCLVILLKNLSGGRSATARPDLKIIRICRRRTVLDTQIRQRAGAQVSAMAGPAGHTACPAEVVFIDSGDHLDHSTRRAFHCSVYGKPFPSGIAVRSMAIQAVQAQSSGNHSHGVHELVHWNSLKNLHVLEKLFRHLWFWFRSALAAGHGYAQKAHHYHSRHTDNCSP